MSAPAPGSEPVVRRGWLQKRGEHIRTWRARYFVLYACGELAGFRAPPAPDLRDPDNRFTVRGCQLMLSDKPRPHSFVLRLRAVEVVERHFSVDSDTEREAWVWAIRTVAAQLGPVGAGHSFAMSLDNFEFVKVLARGTFGKVQLSRERSSGKLYLIQIIERTAGSGGGPAEYAHLQEITRHPFLTALRNCFQTAERACFLTEYANGGDLLHHLTVAGVFPEERARFYLAEVTSALGYLHDEGIVYRDLRLENLLLDCEGHIKITNFGLCKTGMGYGRTTRTRCGCPDYLPPEVLRGQEYGPAVDWWAAGVAMYHMVCGHLPFARSSNQLVPTVEYREVRFPGTVTVECRGLVAALLRTDPAERLGSGPDDALDVMHHCFFASIDWDLLIARKVPPPLRPRVRSRADTRYLDARRVRASLQRAPQYAPLGGARAASRSRSAAG